jgi:Na+/H+ antiporter NhaD/arsenite permease-like protein
MAAPTPDPSPWLLAPFAAILLSIAFAPIVLRRHWERHYRKVAITLGAIPVAYYLFYLHDATAVAHLLHEYISFIVLIGALFTVAGGIHITLRENATPARNLLFLACGALAANIIGTTGAAMLLIRPWMRINRARYAKFHTVFFIFVVANSGGCLTPIANPPLFLGFIKGVPFLWVLQHCWPAWLIINAAQLLIFYLFDRVNYSRSPRAVDTVSPTRFSIRGAHNLLFFAVILGALFISDTIPFLREALMVAAAILSCVTTPQQTRKENNFSFAPIEEVAWLFAGIFTTMLPALDYLQVHASQFGLGSPLGFYWLTGSLSAVLDNAPTYLAFAATAFGLHHMSLDNAPDMSAFLAHDQIHLLAISLGAVFFGAMTYLGNGPNLMVKSITETEGLPTPNFAEYIYRYSVPILLPLLALISWIFFR